MFRILSLLSILLFFSQGMVAQELNARVELQAPQVQNANKRVLDLLQKVIQEYLNNRGWTEMGVRPEERIDCSMVITITSWDGSKEYEANAQIFSSRPVYGTSYNSPVLAYRDRNFNFSYVEGEQLDFSDTQSLSSLGSLLGFYANVIIGMDMDTFKIYGGNPAFAVARNILNYSQNSQQEGWRSMEAMDNRYWLINNLMDRKYNPYRDFAYNYHLNGLDKMAANETEVRRTMVSMLDKLSEVDRGNTGNVLTSVLFSAKANEFVGIYGRLPGNESIKVYNQLVELDPANSSKYEELR